MTEPAATFSIRLRRAARVLRWSVGTMVVAFATAWIAATRQSDPLVRAAMLIGALGFLCATLCFVWLAFQAATHRRRPSAPPS